MEDTPLRGREIAEHYVIIGLLEDRGSSAVYLAQDSGSPNNTRYLLKLTRDDSDQAWQRCLEERQQPVIHHNIARRVGEHRVSGNDLARGCWQVFERPGSGTLAAWLIEQGYAIDPIRAVKVMRQVCGAVAYLHRHEPPLLHKLITPENVGVVKNAEGEVSAYLCDYGMTHVEPPLQMLSAHTLSAMGRGAPEQFEPIDVSDERTDVYHIGATLYELVTGQRPATGLFSRVERADLVNPGVPQPIAETIARAMNPDAGQRFASVTALDQALEKAIQKPSLWKKPEFWIAVGLVLLAIVAFIWWARQGSNTPSNTPIMPQPTPNGSQVITPTALPVVLLPTLTPTATPDIVATLAAADARLVPIAGPLAGELPATAADAGVAQVTTSVADFAIEAVFVNPDAPTWDYGFMFRHSLTGHYRLSVASNGTWLLIYRQEDPNNAGFSVNLPSDPHTTPLALGAGETNHLRLLVVGPYGTVTINGQEVAKVGLWNKVEAGDTYIAAGLRGALNGTPVTYRDLFVRGPQ